MIKYYLKKWSPAERRFYEEVLLRESEIQKCAATMRCEEEDEEDFPILGPLAIVFLQ